MSYVVPIAYPDPPYVVDTSVTPIPAISDDPLQIIADTGVQTGVGVTFNDSTGNFVGVYVGDPDEEQLLCIVGNGLSGLAWGSVKANSRISIRSMTNSPVTFGLISVIVVSV